MKSLAFLKNKTIASIHMFVMVMMFILVVIVTMVVIYNEYNKFDDEAKIIQQKFIKQQKETIRFDTQRVLQFIKYMYDKRDKTQDESVIKQEITDVIEELYGREDGTGYIFIYDFNGVVLSDPVQRENIGQNLYDIEDVNGVKVIKDLIDVSRSKDGGYIEYTWLKPTTGKQSSKVSYAKSFEPWGWMVGTGVYLDEIEKKLAQQRNALKLKLNQYMVDILFLLSILFALGVVGIVVANNILKKEIETFSNFFKKAAFSHAFIDEDKIKLREFKQMVSYINSMISSIHQRKEKLRELNANLELKVEEKTKDLYEKNLLLTEEKNFSNSLVEAQDSFIKHSIHEINTPLAVIMTHIDLFKIKEGNNRYLSKIEAASKIISNIYEDLSYMVKKNRFEYKAKEIILSDFVLERVDFFDEISLGNRHKIVTEVEKGITLYFSPEKLQRIIDNNLSNAIKFAKKGTDIKVTLWQKNDELILSFLSHSPKIKDTKGIFDAYKRENDVKGGFGLGLEIVHSICVEESIRIDLSSDDKQTVFTYIFTKEAK